jgi:P-type Ca2+ transporter type 2C
MVVRGRGRAVVVATGSATMVGQLATELLTSVEGKPPLVERLEDFSRRIAIAVLVAAIIVGLIGIFKQGYSLTEMFLFGVALAVSAIPEGLPVAITVALAIATNRMARQKVIVRRLPAVEGLGSCSLIATDKTGTLTCNELTVRTIYTAEGNWFDVTGKGFAPQGKVLFQQQEIFPESYPTLNALARTAVLCNEADLHHRHENWVWRGDPTDIAMLSLAHKLGWNQETALEEYPQVNEIPFEPEHRFAATYHHIAGKQMVFVKGAPERVLSMCDLSSHSEAEELSAIARQLAVQGYRVLALAEGTLREAITST